MHSLDRSSTSRRSTSSFPMSFAKKLHLLDEGSNHTVQQGTEASDKMFLGIKYSLGHRRTEKAKVLAIRLESGKVVFELEAPFCATIFRVRRTLEMAATETIPPRFQFLYSDYMFQCQKRTKRILVLNHVYQRKGTFGLPGSPGRRWTNKDPMIYTLKKPSFAKSAQRQSQSCGAVFESWKP
jgi:hypothetical protein